MTARPARAAGGRTPTRDFLDLVARETAEPTVAEMVARLNRETTASISTDDVLAAIEAARTG